MGAHVVVGVQLAIAVTRDQHRLTDKSQRHVVAGLSQLLDASDVEPRAFEVLVDLTTQNLRAGVDLSRRVACLVQLGPGQPHADL